MNKVRRYIASQVLEITRDFLRELASPWAYRSVSLDASLEQDLGIDSLKRAELLHRVELTFQIQFSDALILNINTLKDIVIAVQEAEPSRLIPSREFAPILKEADFDPSSVSTLTEVLMGYGEKEPNRPHIYLQDEHGFEQVIQYGELLEGAMKIAHSLHERGFEKGDTVAILLPTSADFFYAFFGILLAGGVPVPIYPPINRDQIEEYAKREVIILRNAGARILITFHRAEGLSKLLQAFIPSLVEVTTVDVLIKSEPEKLGVSFKGEDSALIQYTSGSTGDPKGVLLNHNNLLGNIRAYGEAMAVTPKDRIVSWLPLYHDMGLIGAWLGSLYHGVPITILSPLAFLARPERWLWSIHYHHATLSAAPNFAYELCTNKISDEAIEGLNLSSWRLALNGAEAIYPKTIRRFIKRFSAYGFKKESLFPAYGLAECSVALACSPIPREPVFDKVDREVFDREGIAKPVSIDAKSYREFVSCGVALPGHEIRIVDESDRLVGECRVGHLQFRGPSRMQGYYRNPIATEAVLHDDWCDTGDLAYLANGELYITGRKKDIIIKAGRNLYPEEIEEITSHATGIRKGCVIAFGTRDSQRGTEKLIIVAETHKPTSYTLHEIRDDVIKKVTVHLGISPDEVILIPARSIPKTSSGKLRRSTCKENYLNGKMVHHKTPVWFQISRLFFRSALKRIKAWFAFSARLIYTLYLWLLFALVIPVTWLFVVLFPRKIAAKSTQLSLRLLVYLSGWRAKIKGLKNLNKNKSFVVVANHASYIDVLVLIAFLPASFVYVGKKELLDYSLLRSFMKKLRYLTVDRMDFSKSSSDIENMHEALRDGYSIVIFAEGLLTSSPGLRPFKSGAFKLAVETDTPVCPVAIKGTRSILRDPHWLLKLGRVSIHVGEPIYPQAKNWGEISRLAEISRNEIAKHCGEGIIKI